MSTTKISITHEGGANHGPVTVTRTWSKDGSQPAGAIVHNVLLAPSHQDTFELEDGVAVAIAAGDLTAPPAAEQQQQQ